jgi:hypothetical protein
MHINNNNNLPTATNTDTNSTTANDTNPNPPNSNPSTSTSSSTSPTHDSLLETKLWLEKFFDSNSEKHEHMHFQMLENSLSLNTG